MYNCSIHDLICIYIYIIYLKVLLRAWGPARAFGAFAWFENARKHMILPTYDQMWPNLIKILPNMISILQNITNSQKGSLKKNKKRRRPAARQHLAWVCLHVVGFCQNGQNSSKMLNKSLNILINCQIS